jgi:hypothetical protein
MNDGKRRRKDSRIDPRRSREETTMIDPWVTRFLRWSGVFLLLGLASAGR